MKKTTLNDLKGHLFDVIERLKDSNDPGADKKDTIDIETAKAITSTAQVIINAIKLEVDAIRIMSKADNYTTTREMISNSGIIQENGIKAIDK